jgi:arginine decarboxylase
MKTENPQVSQVDRFFSGTEARYDRWRRLLQYAREWESAASQRSPEESHRARVVSSLEELKQWEDFYAYPGYALLGSLSERAKSGDAVGTARLARMISTAIVSHSFRENAGEWEKEEEVVPALADRLPLSGDQRNAHRPYFEVLIVSPARQAAWRELREDFRRLRRRQDKFVYESVFVDSFEDAVLAIVMNGGIEAVVIYDDVPFASQRNNPVLREFLASYLSASGTEVNALQKGSTIAEALKLIRPELDIYSLSDREVEKAAGSAEAACFRRIFYQVEEPLELHLSILDGIADRYSTPYFDNLQTYAQRPIGTFHALPVARGKSIFKSNWIRDMGEFYGMNLFLAESSATTGGLDSLLEPTGNIKVAQDYAARAFGADRVFFVTNGTSTSNKMVEQALLSPGDIVLVDRNCHKSHHYGAVLTGALPLYVEAYPLTKFSMYGAVPLKTIKKALLDLKAEGKLDRARMLVLTNCTFDGHIYNVERVMEECLAIKPDLIFLWDEAWFGFAHWSPFYRGRTAMGAAAKLEKKFKDPGYLAAYKAQAPKLGEALDPKDKSLLETRLLANPEKVHLRVYQTNSIHKSMSCLRQGSIVLVKDQDYHTVEEQFHEAVFTHASTSPNLQIIASIDVARRQMELEGYELVNRAIQLALDLRREVNTHPLISKYFRILGADELIPSEFRNSGFVDYLAPGVNWANTAKALHEDEFALDVTRLTLVCGTAGFDGTQFKNILAAEYDIQLNKTSRNSVLLQTNINNTRSDIAHLIKVLVEISQKIEAKLAHGGSSKAFAARVQSLMHDVPNLPNFSCFHSAFRENVKSLTSEGDMRTAFFGAYREEQCEHVKLASPEIDARLKDGPEMVSANFVIPYPPGFPIMVPGQVINAETIEFMRKLDVKEIHGYEATLGLKLLKPSFLASIKGKSLNASRDKKPELAHA